VNKREIDIAKLNAIKFKYGNNNTEIVRLISYHITNVDGITYYGSLYNPDTLEKTAWFRWKISDENRSNARPYGKVFAFPIVYSLKKKGFKITGCNSMTSNIRDYLLMGKKYNEFNNDENIRKIRDAEFMAAFLDNDYEYEEEEHYVG
jgi:hypothetical protein